VHGVGQAFSIEEELGQMPGYLVTRSPFRLIPYGRNQLTKMRDPPLCQIELVHRA